MLPPNLLTNLNVFTVAFFLPVVHNYALRSSTGAVWLSVFALVLSFLSSRLVSTSKLHSDAGPQHRRTYRNVVTFLVAFPAGMQALKYLGPTGAIFAAYALAGTGWVKELNSKKSSTLVIFTLASIATLLVTHIPGTQMPFSSIKKLIGVMLVGVIYYLPVVKGIQTCNGRDITISGALLAILGGIQTYLFPPAHSEDGALLFFYFLVALGCISVALWRGVPSVFQLGNAGTLSAGLVISVFVVGNTAPAASFGAWHILNGVSLICLWLAHRTIKGKVGVPQPFSQDGFDPTELFHKSDSLFGNGSVFFSLLANPRERKLAIFLLLTLTIMLLEFVYGIAVNSLGLISDSFHMLLDGTSIAIGLYAAHAASWKPNESTHPFGYARYEVFGGFVNGILLLFIALYVTIESVQRIIDPPEIEGPYLLLVSVVGLVVNIIGVVFFHDSHGHSHSHSHGDGCSAHVDHNMRGVYLHILADLLGSVSVIISSLLIRLFGWWVADPICSAMSAGLILMSSFPLLEETGKVLLLAAPDYAKNYCEELRQQIIETSLVVEVEMPKLWTHSTPPRELTFCVVGAKLRSNVNYVTARKAITSAITASMSQKFDLHNIRVVVHLE